MVNGVNQPYTFETLNLAELKDDEVRVQVWQQEFVIQMMPCV